MSRPASAPFTTTTPSLNVLAGCIVVLTSVGSNPTSTRSTASTIPALVTSPTASGADQSFMRCCGLGNQTYLHTPGHALIRHHMQYAHVRYAPFDRNVAHQVWSTKHLYFACVMPKCGIRNWLHIFLHQHMSDADVHAFTGRATLFGYPWFPDLGE